MCSFWFASKGIHALTIGEHMFQTPKFFFGFLGVFYYPKNPKRKPKNKKQKKNFYRRRDICDRLQANNVSKNGIFPGASARCVIFQKYLNKFKQLKTRWHACLSFVLEKRLPLWQPLGQPL